MDFLEGFFKSIWKTQRQKDKKSSSTCRVADIEKYLKTILAIHSSGNFEPNIYPSLKTFGIWGHFVFVPDQINFFSDRNLNKKIYFYMVLRILALQSIKINQKYHSGSRIGASLLTLRHMHKLNSWLDSEFSGFCELEEEIIGKMCKQLNAQSFVFFALWRRLITSRSQPSSEDLSLLDKLVSQQKRNDTVPKFLLYTVPLDFIFSPAEIGDNSVPKDFQRAKVTSEKQEGFNKPVKQNQLDKEENNPVIHSFEKMETVDEYEKAGRFSCGEDEILKHGHALDEVEMGNVTTEGETSQSLYQSDSYSVQFSQTAEVVEVKNSLRYPEWDDKKNSYIQDHCALYISTAPSKKSDSINLDLKSTQRTNMWKQKILSLVDQPKWKNNLLDGSEIDIDGYCRFFSDFKSGHSPNTKIFSDKKKAPAEIAFSILFDQSLSTDSWVNNQHIIGTIKESLVGLKQLLMEVSSEVMVAGTFSATRNNCNLLLYKSFQEGWVDYLSRVYAVEPKGYTRLGPSIRHVTKELVNCPVQKKILLLISDGKPTDLDYYEGQRGIKDVRKARLEAEAMGVTFISIILDKKNRSHFSDMFSRYQVIQSPDKFLPVFFRLIYDCFEQK